MKELLNARHPLSAVLSCIGEELQRLLEETPLIEDKIRLIQRFLAHRLHTLVNVDPLVDAAVSLIQSTRGSLPVKTVCQELGDSKQYLERKFRDQVGLSPKMFSRILRFQSAYDHWMIQPASKIFWQEHAELYYDQAHFIREFKQFTGFSPLEYTHQVNELMQAVYQQ
jgi:AraC-like DNA-binding protein